MTLYIFWWFLQFMALCLASGQDLLESNTVYFYGLPELTRDILERIKVATGQPIDTNYFMPILAAASRGYEVIEHHPYKKTSEYHKVSDNKDVDGGFYHSKDGKKGAEHEKDHYYHVANSGKDGEDSVKHQYGDHSGKKHKYHEGRFYKKNHHKGGGGKSGSKSKKGRKHGKSYVEKGFRDIYHKDEEKKSDFYWNNQQEEGKWIHYGLVNRKTDKSSDKGNEEKKKEEKTEESAYEKEKAEKTEKVEESVQNKKEKYTSEEKEQCDECKT